MKKYITLLIFILYRFQTNIFVAAANTSLSAIVIRIHYGRLSTRDIGNAISIGFAVMMLYTAMHYLARFYRYHDRKTPPVLVIVCRHIVMFLFGYILIAIYFTDPNPWQWPVDLWAYTKAVVAIGFFSGVCRLLVRWDLKREVNRIQSIHISKYRGNSFFMIVIRWKKGEFKDLSSKR